MRLVHIEAKYDKKIILPKINMPKTIGLFTTVQFIDQISELKNQLEKQGFIVKLFTPKHTIHKGQILGCNIEKFEGVDGFLYVGDGEFHPIALSIENDKPVFVFNPMTEQFSELDMKSVDRYKKKKDIALKRFLMADKVGILVSTKPGQNQLNKAIKLKKKLKKESFILLADDIDFAGLENFPFIECFINTACARISFEDQERTGKSIISIDDITSDMVN